MEHPGGMDTSVNFPFFLKLYLRSPQIYIVPNLAPNESETYFFVKFLTPLSGVDLSFEGDRGNCSVEGIDDLVVYESSFT